VSKKTGGAAKIVVGQTGVGWTALLFPRTPHGGIKSDFPFSQDLTGNSDTG
jgi:hypothetical protein